MAKANHIEPCMFCDEAPCVCNKPAPKAKPIKKPKSKPVKTTELDFSTSEIPTVKPVFKVRETAVEATERDLSLEAALRNLLPILAPQSKRKAEQILNTPYPREVDMRVAKWKGGKRNGKNE